jgi:hypothetical protein
MKKHDGPYKCLQPACNKILGFFSPMRLYNVKETSTRKTALPAMSFYRVLTSKEPMPSLHRRRGNRPNILRLPVTTRAGVSWQRKKNSLKSSKVTAGNYIHRSNLSSSVESAKSKSAAIMNSLESKSNTRKQSKAKPPTSRRAAYEIG